MSNQDSKKGTDRSRNAVWWDEDEGVDVLSGILSRLAPALRSLRCWNCQWESHTYFLLLFVDGLNLWSSMTHIALRELLSPSVIFPCLPLVFGYFRLLFMALCLLSSVFSHFCLPECILTFSDFQNLLPTPVKCHFHPSSLYRFFLVWITFCFNWRTH